jgi:streptogramin lyase
MTIHNRIDVTVRLRKALMSVSKGASVVATAWALTATIGCSSLDPARSQGSGTIQMALVTSAGDVTYRLHAARFVVSGPTAIILDSEVQPEATRLSATLASGTYSINLEGGWDLGRQDGANFVQVQATLVSVNPTNFRIATGGVTDLAYQFRTDGGVITIGNGTLNVSIEVIGPDAASAQPIFTEFAIPTTASAPQFIAAGFDGNVWFTESAGNRIGRITPAGTVIEFPLPTPGSSPSGIAAGPDGNVWFTEINGNRIGRITPAGIIAEFSIPTDASGPFGIVAGPDGNLWFTENHRIGRITPNGTITEFPIPAEAAPLFGIAAGSDGNLWFTAPPTNEIGRITPLGTVTEFPLPIMGGGPLGVVAGADGNLWFVEQFGNRVGRITPLGTVSGFPIPTPGSGPQGIASGADGNLWFTETEGNKIGRITTSGSIDEFPVPTAAAQPVGIAAGPDGNIWFTESSSNKIGRITSGGLVAPRCGDGVLSPAEFCCTQQFVSTQRASVVQSIDDAVASGQCLPAAAVSNGIQVCGGSDCAGGAPGCSVVLLNHSFEFDEASRIFHISGDLVTTGQVTALITSCQASITASGTSITGTLVESVGTDRVQFSVENAQVTWGAMTIDGCNGIGGLAQDLLPLLQSRIASLLVELVERKPAPVLCPF